MITQEVTLLRIGLFGHSPLVKIIKTLQVAGHLEFLDYRNVWSNVAATLDRLQGHIYLFILLRSQYFWNFGPPPPLVRILG